MEECTWDCDVMFDGASQLITNTECLKDCFEDTPCVQMILEDPTCNPEKEKALREPECIQKIYKQQPLVYGTITEIIANKYYGTIADTEVLCFQLVEILANYNTTSRIQAFAPFVED